MKSHVLPALLALAIVAAPILTSLLVTVMFGPEPL